LVANCECSVDVGTNLKWLNCLNQLFSVLYISIILCAVVDCGNLLNPRFGKVVLTGTTFGSTCTYSCQKGYILVGGSIRTCHANGLWSGQAPVCNSKVFVIQCCFSILVDETKTLSLYSCEMWSFAKPSFWKGGTH